MNKISEDEQRVAVEKQNIKGMIRRLATVKGRLESAESLDLLDKSQLYNELYSIRNAIAAEAKHLKRDLVQEIIDLLDAGENKRAILIAHELLKMLKRKDYEI